MIGEAGQAISVSIPFVLRQAPVVARGLHALVLRTKSTRLALAVVAVPVLVPLGTEPLARCLLAVVVEAFSEALLHCAPFLRVPARAQHSATNAPARLFGLATLLTLLVRIADGAGLALAVLAVQLTTAKRRTRLILEVSPERRGARGPLGGHGQTKTAKAAQVEIIHTW